ncbi:hypothetical protein MPL3365_270058 [Mesorhizobium plurifarium]|uniref:Uncharacterized protein n=1 Tax=Mesorhizobium plurifarium TaxID=69974 RepID=A0A090G5T1_MESPL|nr:hypothetical protein MPL3365_270058 [Mesorhizobium plurifarium]
MRAVVVEAEILPERDAADADDAEDRAEHHPGRQLAQRHPPPVAQPDLAQRQRADNERRRLRAGIAAGAHDQRDEQGQHDRLFQLALVALHGVGRQHLAEEQRAEPAGALLDHGEKTHLHIGLVQRLHAAEAMHVLGRLLDHRVDDVVDGDDAEDPAVIDDRQSEQVVFGDGLRQVLAIGERRHRHRHAVGRHRQDRILRVAGDQPAQSGRTQQELRVRVDDIDGVDGFARALDLADVVERAANGPVGRHADEFRRHDRGGAAFRISQDGQQRRAQRRRQGAEQFRAGRFVQLAQDVGRAVDRHGGQQLARLRARQGLGKLRCRLEFRLVENLDQPLERHGAEQLDGRLAGLVVEGFDDVGDVIVGKNTGDGDGFVVQYGCEFVHGSLLAVRQDVSHQVTSGRTAVAFDCDCRQAWRVDLSARGVAHDPENRLRFSERIMRNSKFLQRPLRVRRTRGAVVGNQRARAT